MNTNPKNIDSLSLNFKVGGNSPPANSSEYNGSPLAASKMDTLQAILAELGIPKESLHNDTRLHEDLQLDSTEIVEIALRLKRQLGVSVKLESRQDMTLAQVCHQIEAARLANSNSNHVS